MENTEESGSPSWGASFFMQTTEDVARAVAAAAAAAVAARSPRPSVVYSSKVDNESGLQKLQHQVSKLLKGLSTPPEVKRGNYNPEILTSQKRQWASFQLQSLDHKIWREPSRLFESMVVVGLHPNCDIQALQNLYSTKKSEGSGRFRSALNGQHQSRVGPNLEPQVLFVYPPEKQLPLKYKDLLSFCFPAGVEVHAIERTPSMSELNEILLGQEHLKQSDLSFVFRLQVADDSTLYGCCVLVDEIVQKPSGLISMISEGQPGSMGLSRHILTTRRCYCILSRLPFYELHFGVLNSIFTEERLERLTKNIGDLDLELHGGSDKEDTSEEESGSILLEDGAQCMLNGAVETSPSILSDSVPGRASEDGTHLDSQLLDRDVATLKKNDDGTDEVSVDSDTRKHHGKIETVGETHSSEVCAASVEDGTHLDSQLLLDRDAATSKKNDDGTDEVLVDSDTSKRHAKIETVGETHSSEVCDASVDDLMKSPAEKHLPDAVLPLLRYQQYESSESSVSFQGSPADVRNFRSDLDEAEVEEPSFSGQGDFSDHNDILEWAKANNHGSLQIICEYYRLRCPPHGSTIRFHPLDHLHPLEYHRIDESVLHIAGSTIDLKSCNTSLELAEAHYALMAEEEANALSVWAVACLCGSLRLEHVLTLFAAALLEKQIAVVCSNLGLLSASILSIIPLIRPYQWQSLLMPVLPNDMLEFLDAPVPYIVGVKNKTTDVQSKLTNVTLVDLNKNQVKSSTVPTLPQQKELYQALSPYYAKLVGESYLGKKRPIYEYTDVQVEASKGFLSILRTYLDSLCSNLRSHTITNVQSNDDKVSLLLKESFIESFPSRDRAFMKLFVDTQLFSVHTDFILSFFQKE